MWFFFFKQKTAYEMRISDWSSDVCSSDLVAVAAKRRLAVQRRRILRKIDDNRGIDRIARAECAGHRRQDAMMRPIAHQVHQPNRARLLPAERKARMEVEDTDRPGRPGRIGTHACGSSAAHASIAARASASSIVRS